MHDTIAVTLDFIGSEPLGLRFRVAFHSSRSRWLLPYPSITGLRFVPTNGGKVPEWATHFLITGPRDEFVLNPNDRIAFDLVANADTSSECQQWAIPLQPGDYDVQYVFEVEAGKARYDYLRRGSRFADITPPWVGVVQSNAVRVNVLRVA